MQRQMRIGLVTPAWPGERRANGIATAVRHLHDGLVAIGHAVTVIPLGEDGPPAQEPWIVPVPSPRPATLAERVQMKFGRHWTMQPIIAEQIACAVNAAIRDRHIDVVVMEETHGWAAEVQRRVPIPVVVALHGPWFLLHDLIAPGPPSAADRARIRREAAAFATCAGVMAPSRDVLERTRAAHRAFAEPQAVIPNPITVPDAGLDWGSLGDEGRRRILFVGRFEALKGGDTVLAAFDALVRGGAEARLTFVGPDRGLTLPDGRLQDMAQALAALPEATRSRIDWLGRLGRTEIVELRRGHAIAVMASRYENFPYSLLESLAAGAATVCTAVGGAKEAVRDGETALLVPPSEPDAMAAALRHLIDDPATARRLGAAAREDVEARYAPRLVAETLAAFLETVAVRFAGAAHPAPRPAPARTEIKRPRA